MPPSRREPPPLVVALIAVAIACVMDAMIKSMGARYSTLMVSFARFSFGAVAAGLVYAIARPPPLKAGALKFHILRALSIVVSATTFFYALAHLALIEAVTLGFAAPLLVPFFARALLKEKLSPVSVAAALVGFTGVVIAAYEPSGHAVAKDHALGVAAVLISVVTYALSLILLRHRAADDGPATIGVMGNLLPAAILAVPALTLAPLPAAADLPWFALIGALGAGFWFMLTWAYARAPAQAIAPTDYTALIWSSIWGVTIFHESPRPLTYVGAAFIIGACLLAGWDERRRGVSPAHVIDAEGPLP
jgi:S-adenosylmethionine uptake transporter